MTVYIDDMYLRAMGQFNRMKMSHMIADNDSELHHMAKLIGVSRRWYQGDHYDVCMSKRKLALQYGVVAITLRQCSQMCFIRRVRGRLPTPEQVEAYWKTLQDKLRRPRRSVARIRL
jgi:Protein of unknown function (DUF4031)